MTPAELLAWAARIDMMADGNEAESRTLSARYEWKKIMFANRIANLRLAARLARFAAERGGLTREKADGKEAV
jgi:hypothetical protein